MNYVFRKAIIRNSIGDELVKKVAHDNSQLLRFIECNEVNLAISNPTLYYEYKKIKQNENIKGIHEENLLVTLNNYLHRSVSRATPFGRYAGVGVLKSSHNEFLNMDSALNELELRTIDFYFLNHSILNLYLYDLLFKRKIVQNGCFKVNNSIYQIKNKLRYSEFEVNENGDFIYRISEIERNEICDQIFVKFNSSFTISELNEFLISLGIEEGDFLSIFNLLYDNQLILHDVLPNIFDAQYVQKLINYIDSIKDKKKVDILIIEVLNRLTHLPKECNIDNVEKINSKIYSILGQLGIFNWNMALISCNLYFQCRTDLNLQSLIDLSEFRKDFVQIREFYEYSNIDLLKDFKDSYEHRFEHQLVKLTSLFDSEIGLFLDLNSESEIIEDNRQILDLLDLSGVQNTVNLKELNLNNFSKKDIKLSQVIVKCFQQSINNEDTLIEITGLSNLNSNKLIGRFTLDNPELKEVFCENVEREIEILKDINFDDFVIAELVHYQNATVANISRRFSPYEFEIPYLGESDKNKKKIKISDIYVLFVDRRFYLYSKELNKFVIPRNSCAHNTRFSSHPIYKFISALENDKLIFGYWNWGYYSNKVYLPRIQFGKYIISRSQWSLNFDVIKSLADLNCFALKWKMPQYLIWSNNDNEILINLQNRLSILYLLKLIKKHKKIVLHEDLANRNLQSKHLLSDNSEIIVGFDNTLDNIKINLPSKCILESKQSFLPGDGYLYLKLYCNISNSNDLLNIISIKLLNINNGFFFVRYFDNKFHIRLRFLNPTIELQNELLKIFLELKNVDVLQSVIIDTYSPEYYRYQGRNVYAVTESLFCLDSVFICRSLNANLLTNEFCQLIAVRHLLNLCGLLNIDNKIDFIKMRFVKIINKSNYMRYKEYCLIRNSVLDNQNYSNLILIYNGFLKSCSIQIEHLLDLKSILDVEKWLFDYFHMFCNRLFLFKQNENEKLVYEFLLRDLLKYENKKNIVI
jgi:thiopeptide-type bacteriocin biosynthesis protein